ncbi:MAG: SPOR domain-containing protein [Arenicella sp.]
MAQARQTARKTPNKRQKKKTRSSLPWGLLLIVLVSGAVIGAIAAGYFFNYGSLGQGLKNYNWSNSANTEQSNNDQQSAPVRTEKNFEFYDLLEGTRDRVLPDDFSVEQTARQRQEYFYIMQIATLSSKSAADALRAKLALKGHETTVENKNGKYRLKMGPFSDRRKLKNARNKIKSAGFGLNPIGIQYKKKKS